MEILLDGAYYTGKAAAKHSGKLSGKAVKHLSSPRDADDARRSIVFPAIPDEAAGPLGTFRKVASSLMPQRVRRRRHIIPVSSPGPSVDLDATAPMLVMPLRAFLEQGRICKSVAAWREQALAEGRLVEFAECVGDSEPRIVLPGKTAIFISHTWWDRAVVDLTMSMTSDPSDDPSRGTPDWQQQLLGEHLFKAGRSLLSRNPSWSGRTSRGAVGSSPKQPSPASPAGRPPVNDDPQWRVICSSVQDLIQSQGLREEDVVIWLDWHSVLARIHRGEHETKTPGLTRLLKYATMCEFMLTPTEEIVPERREALQKALLAVWLREALLEQEEKASRARGEDPELIARAAAATVEVARAAAATAEVTTVEVARAAAATAEAAAVEVARAELATVGVARAAADKAAKAAGAVARMEQAKIEAEMAVQVARAAAAQAAAASSAGVGGDGAGKGSRFPVLPSPAASFGVHGRGGGHVATSGTTKSGDVESGAERGRAVVPPKAPTPTNSSPGSSLGSSLAASPAAADASAWV